jgi:hypothetical protein
MFKKIAFGLAAVIVIILGLAAMQPDSYSVTRSASIKAPPDQLIAMIADFNRWRDWSPWEKLDPAMHRTISTPASGPGATYAWTGNKDVGKGRMDIASVTPNQVVINLEFIEPFASRNMTAFTVTPAGDGSKVVWTMSGPMAFPSKIMAVFVSMDRMIGKDFERGLAQMKALAER